MKLIVATSNPGKAKEFREMLGGGDVSWDDLSRHADIAPPEETGTTFRANAMLKASYYAIKLGGWALADDSGLVVDALAGKPGVHSARWAEMHRAGKGDVDNNRLLLQQLQGVEPARRTARFQCVLALCNPKGQVILTTSGTVEGSIIDSPQGDNGFGYDPLFLITELGKTTAELPPDEKHRISHRGRALERLKALLAEHRLIPAAGGGESEQV